jgi:FtsH-binding integral membrane protein
VSTVDTTYAPAVARDRSHELLGQVMGLVAVTVGFTALGAYLGRDLSGGTGLVLFIAAFAAIFGLNAAAASGRKQLATALLFGLGLLLGLAVAPVIADYADADPSALWQAAGATAAFIAAAGAYGYAPAATSARGAARCSGRCSASSRSASSRSSPRSRARTSSTQSRGS